MIAGNWSIADTRAVEDEWVANSGCFGFLTEPNGDRPDQEDHAKREKAFAICHDKSVRLNRLLEHAVSLLQRAN